MFKIALTPCSLRGRPVCTNSGVNQARGRRGGAAVRGERGGVGAGHTRAAPGLGSPTVAAKGRGHPSPSRDPNPPSGKAGSALSGPPPCAEGTGVTLVSLICCLRTIMSPSARAPDTKYLARGRLFLSESALRLVIVPGRDGKASLRPEKTGVWRLCALPLPAPVFPTVAASAGTAFEA